MKEELITYETAVLAKHKGFQELCYYYYNERGSLKEPYLENGSSTDCDFRVDLTDLLNNNNYSSYRYSAPTQALLQRWLREMHQINIIILTSRENNINGYTSKVNGTLVWEHFNTYEEALEKGLQEGLNLIK